MKLIKITRDNYEEFAIDYIEGNLPADLKKEFENFLSENPDIFDELVDIQNIKLPKPEIKVNKLYLKKSPLKNINYEEFLMISAVERTLSKPEKKDLEFILATNEAAQKDFALYKKTKLPEPQIIYPYKQELYRKNPKALVYSLMAAAASLLLFLILNPKQVVFEEQTTEVYYPPAHSNYSYNYYVPSAGQNYSYGYQPATYNTGNVFETGRGLQSNTEDDETEENFASEPFFTPEARPLKVAQLPNPELKPGYNAFYFDDNEKNAEQIIAKKMEDFFNEHFNIATPEIKIRKSKENRYGIAINNKKFGFKF